MVIDGVSYSGKGLPDGDDAAGVGLWVKGRQAANLHLQLSRGGDRKLKGILMEGGAVSMGDCGAYLVSGDFG